MMSEENGERTTMRASELARAEVVNCLACLATNRLNIVVWKEGCQEVGRQRIRNRPNLRIASCVSPPHLISTFFAIPALYDSTLHEKLCGQSDSRLVSFAHTRNFVDSHSLNTHRSTRSC